ncbi:MAG: UvrD-helicase domain-containing protein [Bacteroidaceae bacterium]|nr:UvrD-helicase domain-containing protein [Bacteroidaceae bacterium]
MNEIRNELNEAQWEAVRYLDGPELVIAGAGSGKTRVLTYKIAFLLEHGMCPWNILALTFTNKAAREMRERIVRQVGEEKSRGLVMGTFHSVFARILRREAQAIGFNERFTIYDQDDSRSLVKTIIREMQLDEKKYTPKDVANIISRAKERLLTPSAFRSDRQSAEAMQMARMTSVGTIYERYQERLRQANAMDFDDLLMQTYLLFQNNEEVRLRYVQKFQYVLVDEYQDTNFAQHAIIRQLTKENCRLCVVGDDAQSIYSFRGANIENILRLEEVFPSLRIFKLEQNYRSTQNIVNAANSVIAKNRKQYQKKVFSTNDVGEPIYVLTTVSDLEEADVVVRKIAANHRNYAYRDMAILYRTNAQSRTFEEAMRRVRIPYRIYGGLSFYQRKEVKDVIAYCRVTVNPYDEEALRRIINYPARGIGNTTLTRLSECAGALGCGLWQVLLDMPPMLDVSAGAKKKLVAFRDLIKMYIALEAEVPASELMSKIIRTSGIYEDLWHSSDPDDISRQENVQELINACTAFEEAQLEAGDETLMRYYLQEVSLLTDMDQDDTEGDDKVTLMTIHAAKGLEFPVVHVVGMEEEIFPGEHASDSPKSLEEERRLFYVALTRAGSLCYLSHARMRRRYGQTNFQTPSRFLKDIDSRLIRAQRMTFGR